jgi:hypothetical protein
VGGEPDPHLHPPRPDPESQTPEEPPPTGIYLDCTNVTPKQCEDAITRLNEALDELGIMGARFALLPPRNQLVLVDKTSTLLGENDRMRDPRVLTPDHPTVRGNAALGTLVEKVNRPDADISMVVVNNKFAVPWKKPNGEIYEVTTTMAQPFNPEPGAPLQFFFNVEAYSAYRKEADDIIKRKLKGKDPLNPAALLVNEIVEAEKVHEFNTTGAITDLDGNVTFRGNPSSLEDRRDAHRGTDKLVGYADRISTAAEQRFRTAAGLAARAGSEGEFLVGFHEWPSRKSEADGALFAAFETVEGNRIELIVYHYPDGSIEDVAEGRRAAKTFWANWRDDYDSLPEDKRPPLR